MQYSTCLWLTSALGFRSEFSSRDLIESIVDPVVPPAAPTLFLPLKILPQLEFMDIEALFDSAQQTMDAVALNVRASSNSYRRSKLEKGWPSNVRESKGNKLPNHKPEKQPIFPKVGFSAPLSVPNTMLPLPHSLACSLPLPLLPPKILAKSTNVVDPPTTTLAPHSL